MGEIELLAIHSSRFVNPALSGEKAFASRKLYLKEQVIQPMTQSLNERRNLEILCSQPHLALQLNCFPGICYIIVSGQWRLTSKKRLDYESNGKPSHLRRTE